MAMRFCYINCFQLIRERTGGNGEDIFTHCGTYFGNLRRYFHIKDIHKKPPQFLTL